MIFNYIDAAARIERQIINLTSHKIDQVKSQVSTQVDKRVDNQFKNTVWVQVNVIVVSRIKAQARDQIK